jgi:predicted RNA-binding protein YlqC (UPF0109 family)
MVDSKMFLEKIVGYLVNTPSEVSITEVEGKEVNILKLRVAKGEIGFVIGKNGKIANSIRILLSAVSARAGKRVILEILD